MSEQEPQNLRIPLQPQLLADNGQDPHEAPSFERRPLTNSERNVISPWRQKYLAEPDKKQRYCIIKEHVFVAIFNYWDIAGEGNIARQQEEARIKMVMGFIHNNWRRGVPLQFDGAGDVVIRKRDLIFETMRTQVDAEITSALGLAVPVTTAHPEYFSNITSAICRVNQSLTPEDEAILWNTQRQRRKIGHPPDVQKRIFAKSGRARIRGATSVHHKQMGVLQWSVIAYKNSDNKWAVSVMDDMAGNVNVTQPPIIAMWPKEVEAMQRIMLRYVNTLSALSDGPLADTAGNIAPSVGYIPRHDLQIRMSVEGYPLMPERPQDKCTQNVKEVALLLRTYLNHHYRIASGGQNVSAPYSKVAADNGSFVDSQYLPSDIPLRDPTNMLKGDIVACITHIRDRQESHGHADAFRWKAYEHGGSLTNALYGIPACAVEGIDTPAEKRKARAAAARAKRKGKGKTKSKAKGKQKEKEKSPTNEMPSPASASLPASPSAPSTSHWAHGLTESSTDPAAQRPLQCVPVAPVLSLSEGLSTDQDTWQSNDDMMLLSDGHYLQSDAYRVQDDMSSTLGIGVGIPRATYPAANEYGNDVPIHIAAGPSHSVQGPSCITNYANYSTIDATYGSWYQPPTIGSHFAQVPAFDYTATAPPHLMAPSGLGTLQTHSHIHHPPLHLIPRSHTDTLGQLSGDPDLSHSTNAAPIAKLQPMAPNVSLTKRKQLQALQDIQPPSVVVDSQRPRKRIKTTDDLAAEEAKKLMGGGETLKPRSRTSYKDMMILKAQQM